MGLFDFSKMKKVATDGKTTTFEHERGHRMVILHAALPKIQQEQIKRLALYRGGKVQKLADGTPEEPIKKDDQAPLEIEKIPDAASASHDTHITINAAPAAPAPIVPPGVTARVAAPPANPNLLLPDKTLNAPAAVGLQQKAIAEQVPISAAASQAVAQNEQENVAKQQEIAKQQTQHYNELKSHTDEFANYVKQNPINPRAYQESQTAAQKSQTAIGLFLGGLGGGGTSNVALDFLNKQIDRDVAAQQKNVDNRSTIFGAYQHLYDDSNIATNLAKVSANDILVHKTNVAAAKLGTPQAMQKAHELEAQKAIDNNQLLLQAAGRMSLAAPGGHHISGSVNSYNPHTGANSLKQSGPPAGDEKLTPGSATAPWIPSAPKINIDKKSVNTSQMLGAQGTPGSVLPGEVGEINSSIGLANATNDAIEEIHHQFQEMWKNAGGIDALTGALSGQHLFGAKLPDLAKMGPGAEEAKRYFTAASSVKKQLGNVMKGSPDASLYELIEEQLPKTNDTPKDFRDKISNIDKIIIQRFKEQAGALDKLGLVDYN